MKIALIICTYQRPNALTTLLDSVRMQSCYPDEIVVVDGSRDDLTQLALSQKAYPKLRYYKVDDADRGLTRQRNYGIARVSADQELVAFLDDDTVVEPDYFEQLIATYQRYPDAVGVGGYISNEVSWLPLPDGQQPTLNQFAYDGWVRTDGTRFVLRKRLGLDSDCPPGFMPSFSHGRSISFLPPSGRIYPVEQLMGGVSSFRKTVFEQFRFSTYFDGYGLYEDADFTLRVSKTGNLYVNTAARLAHYHDPSGRPDLYRYGQMVVRNGYYVWRVKYPHPPISGRIKWHLIVGLLTFIRLTNVLTTSEKRSAWRESLGRLVGWCSIFVNPPKPKSND